VRFLRLAPNLQGWVQSRGPVRGRGDRIGPRMSPRRCPSKGACPVRRDFAVRAGASIAWGIVVAVAGYAIARAIQSVASPGPDPAAVVWSARSGYLWRVSTVVYAGSMTAFVTFFVAGRRLHIVTRALVPAISAAALLLALQAAFLP